MPSSSMSVDITKKSFWAQRLQSAENTPATSVLFDKTLPSSTSPLPVNDMPSRGYADTTPAMGVNPSELKVAAVMHYLSADSLVLAAWAILCRSYAGEDGPVNFGACIDGERAAWLFAMAVSGEDRLLGAVRAAEEEKKLVVDHSLMFESLQAFAEDTGHGSLSTAVYIHSGKPKNPEMHHPSLATLIVCVGEGSAVQVNMHYRQDAMTTERAQSIVDNFNHVLGVLTKRMQSANKSQLEEMLVRDVDTVSRSDYRRVVDFSSPLPQKVEACVHELILSRCAAPDADTKYAVEAWDGSFTYAELAKHAKRLARAIANAAGHQTRRRGNHQADSSQLFVPFCLTKSKWTPVAILAIMIAGGACVPLEPSHPPARRNEIVTQVKAKVVITNKSLHDQGLADSFSPNTPVRHVICVDDESAYETANFQKALPTVRAEELCYVIFTSGSSGTPKGVKWSHGALSTSAWEHGRAFYIDSSSRVLQFASHVFDVSVAELVTPLVRGACVVIPPDKDRSDPARIATFMNDMKVTTAIIVPSFARLLVQYPIPTLKTVVQGGEPIGQENIEKWTPKIDQFVIGYGAAETCVNCSQNVFSISTREQKPWIEALGKAFGSRIFIADRSNVDRLMPIGAIGEIVVEGPILADGYLNDPAKTANAFIENPAWIYKTHFRNAPARRRFYRTGDLGRQAMDGSITFMGRADFQVKVRGQRMELGEVRSRVVEFLPEAADVHVDVISPSGEDKSLAAFIAFGHGRDSIDIHLPDDALADAMRNMVAQLKEVLTSAGIPSFFIPLAGFPYLVSGKVDRRRLLAFANQSTVDELASYNASFISTGASEKVALEEPETEAEIILVNCCRRVLGVQDFGVNANFFVSGGDSISAIKVVTAARDNGVDISVSDLFGTSSIRELAERVCHTTSHDSASDIAQKLDSYLEPFRLLQPGQVRDITAEIQRQGIPDSHVSDIYPCTPLQEALIALSSTRCGAYVAQHILTLPRHVDLQAFKSSWEFIYQRHEILRTRIFEGSQGAVQAVCDSEIEWRTGRSVAAYCELDKSLPMSFGSTLVRFGLVDRTFVFTIHHSVFDGWSITRLFEDFERHYVGQQPLEIRQYRSFIKYLQDVDADQPNDFWLSALASNSSLASAHFPQNLAASHSPLPDSAAKSTIPIGHYSKSEFTIPTRIRAAWALLMGRYIDSQEVIFGETLSGRMSKMPQVQDVAGPTISTVPFLVKWEPTASLSSLLQSIQGQVIEMTNYGHVGIQNISRLSKTAHEACQFQHLIVIQPKRSSYRGPEEDTQAMRSRVGLEDATLDLRSFHSYTLNMDFTLEEDSITVTTTFDSRVFSTRDIEHLQSQFSHVLDQICSCRDTRNMMISEIDCASEMDRQLQIETNNSQCLPDDLEPTHIIRMLGRHVNEQPNATAVAAWDGSLTYKELDKLSTCLANHLSSIGVRKGDYIPYCFPKSVWTTVAIIGTLKVGAVSVALEPTYPDKSILKVISQVKPKMILCSRDHSSRLRSLGQSTSSLLAIDGRSTREFVRSSNGVAKRKYNIRPDDTAFVVFTSGSTGEPKGIPLDHGAVWLMARQHGRAMNIDKHSRILQFAAYVFDVSIGDLAVSIVYGATLCVPSDDHRINNLAHAINSLGANRAWLTPTVASLISPAECPGMEWLSVGGEQLTQTCKDIWAGVPLINVYGPAEVTNIGTAVQATDSLPLTNIGRGNGVKVWICEPGNTEKLAPVGCVGEIVFEGRNVSRGYFNNAQLTATSFPEVLSWSSRARGSRTSVKMYRTGDLGRLNHDGSIEFKGRRDTQIKLRGQRVEITAVESALLSAIDEPVELAVDILPGSDDGRDAALVVFIYLSGRETSPASNDSELFSNTVDIRSLAADVRSRIKVDLPAHMIPTAFIPLSRMPRLVSGKIDRKLLRLESRNLTENHLQSLKLDAEVEKRQPTNEAETVMQRMWASVLHLTECDVGVDDDFVSLGGDSIVAIKLVAQARAQGLDLTVASIFKHATIASLCGASHSMAVPATQTIAKSKSPVFQSSSLMDTLSSEELNSIVDQCMIREAQIEDVYPSTALQKGMLMLTEKKPTAYIAHHVMQLPHWVDIAVFREAWELVVTENAILRTRIVVDGHQVVLVPEPLVWDTPSSKRLSNYMEQIRQSPMGFGTILTRQAIFEHPKRFVWTAHHSIYDGWSMPLLAEAITKTYMRVSGPKNPALAPEEPAISFKKFIDYVSGINNDKANDYWCNQLSGADPATFPPGIQSSYEPLADAMLEKTIAFSRDSKSTTTSSSIIRAAWALLISSYSGTQTDVVFGSSVTGRSVPIDGVFEMVGPTLATVPVRVRLDLNQTIQDFLSDIQQQSMSMLEFEQYGLQNIRTSVADGSAACDFQSLLVVHAEANAQPSTLDNTFSWRTERDEESNFLTNALTLECEPRGSQLKLTASYDSSLMDQKQMHRILSTLEYILSQLCNSDCNTLIQDIDTISPSDRNEIASITKDIPPPISDRVHDMFARQASMTPDAMAISASDGDFSYRQLDLLSTKLSRHLRSIGVGAECFVPFCFEKSKWVPVALLAILKAGGACVPLDPAQPLDRLQSIIDTLEARVIVTSTAHRDLLKGTPGVQSIVPVSSEEIDRLPRAAHTATRRNGAKSEPTPASACYAIFTSGSTGTPKGVVWEHATLCRSMIEHGAAFNYSPQSRVLQFSSHTFDVSVSELLTTIVHGGCICIPDDYTRMNGITDFIEDKQVNWAFFAPSFARLLDPSTVRSLKTIVLGGEAPGKDNIERWSGRPGLELIVTYGPAESCIYCAKNSVSKGKKMADGSIGHSIGGMMWIADLGRPQRLAPIGSIGEIAVEGSILARGYLKDPEKTAKSFKPMPEDWSRSRSGRVYYTGDLGRVNSDGTISCLGRRDDQVKIRGQRVELADIEYHLRKDDLVHQALVLYPRVGACADKLIGVLSMSTNDRTNKPASAADIEMAQSEDWLHVAAVQQTLENKVPSYMVPSLWIVLDSIPLMVASQKVNRKIVNEWIKTMDKATYDEITSFSTDSIATMASPVADRLEEQIRDIWCSVLNAKPENVGSQTSFFRVGGDSISAMTVVSRCKKEGFQVSVQDLLKTKTLSEFCDRLRVSKSTTSDDLLELIGQDEPEGTSFALSPIQSWFMALAPYGENHFNQSHLLRLTQAVNFNALQTALLKIIQRHPMLRARFEVCSDGDWKQFISADIEGSLQCRSLSSVTMKQAAAYAFSAQAGLDIVSGPLMAADLYTMTDGTQALFITCHHLVVDLVSWRIILQELEDLLMTGKAEDHSAISFSAWTRLLNKEIESPTAPQENAFARAPHADMGFWSICNADNVVATVAEQSFELDAETTQLLLGSSNDAFNTEPLDLLLAAVSHSFNQVFRAFRGPVAIFNESHGREAWRPELDISSTVGWFTSMCPVVLTDHGEDVVRSVQEVKDFRRRFADQGLSFGSFAKNADSAVEVTFNYFGLFQQFERDDSLLNQMNWNTIMQPSDASPDVPRFSLFDISAGVENGTLKMNFAYCKKIKHESLVQQWVSACSEALRDIISVTSECQDDERQCLTLSDFPHLPATYDELSVMLSTTLPNAGVSISNVQDIYPCSPMQTALLMGQAVDKSLYAVRYVWEVVSKRTVQVSLDRLMKSWEQVVQSHPMLRTVFVQGLSSGDGKRAAVYHQVVLRNMKPDVSVCEDASRFPMGRPEDFLQSGAPHHLALCQDATGKLFVQLDISHSLVDGTSIMVIIDSMIKAYDGSRISSGDQECYANFVSYLRRQDTEESLNFWRTYLAGSEPCHFPNLRTQLQTDNEMVLSEASRALEYLDFNYPNPARLHSSCINSDTTTASVYKLAWGLVLQSYTGINSPCFGFLASGRDLPIDDIEGFVGPFINMLVCKVTLEEANDTVKSVLSTAHNDYANCLSHQVCSLAEILRSLQIPGGGRLFNTVMSLQRHLPPGEENSQVEFKTNHVEDPSEFDIVLNIGDSADFVDISLTYNTTMISPQQADHLAKVFNKAIDSVLDCLDKKLNNVDLLTPDDYQQMTKWNSITDMNPVIALCDDLVGTDLPSRASKPAVSGWDLSMTYSELETLSNTLASHLATNYPVGKNVMIPFCFEKSSWAIVVMLGIIKAGAAFVPLDPKHPVDRLAQIVKRVRAPLVITSESKANLGSELGAGLPHLVVGSNAMAALSKKNARSNGSTSMVKTRAFRGKRRPTDLAYCLFTSGSTGTPKGVLIQHQTMCTSTTAHGKAFGYDNSEGRTIQFSSYAFDACIAEIFTTLIMGGCVCVPSDEHKMDPRQLMAFMEKERTDMLFITPAVLALLDPKKLSFVKTLLVGGEAVPRQLVQGWMAPHRRVLVVYGPTECCVYCSGYDSTAKGGLPVGRNMIGTTVGSVSWIGTSHDPNRLAPIGGIGELLIEGPILAEGYLDDKEKTAASFVKPSWMGGDRAVYRTGDLVRYTEDGDLEYMGRRDNQVKLRGQRLELGEIEQQMMTLPDVQQCVVLLPNEGRCRQKITALLKLTAAAPDSRDAGVIPSVAGGSEGLKILSGETITTKLTAICDAVASKLPTYMVPSCWMVTESIPLLPSGKSDRRYITGCINNIDKRMYRFSVDMKLEEADDSEETDTSAAGPSINEPPMSNVARTLRQVWSAVLNIPEKRIDPDSGSFIRMGGDSISAMEVVAQCRSKGVPLLIESLLKAASVNLLAATIEDSNPFANDEAASYAGGSSSDNTWEDDDSDENDDIVLFGLSPIQRMFAKLSPRENHFNQSFLVRVGANKKRLTEDEVRRGLDAVVKRHAMLRARFQRFGRTFKQWIDRNIGESYIFNSWDVEASPPFPREAVTLIEETQKSIDIECGPVFAGDLFNAGPEQYLFLTAHHLVVDLVSWRIILKDLEDFLTQGSISSYRSLTFEDWSGLLNSHRKTLLQAPNPTHLPFDVPGPDYDFWGMKSSQNFASDFEHHQFTLSAEASQFILGPDCNEVLGTEALDIFIAAVMHSFTAAFPNRDLPPIYNEGHGREPWDDSHDLSKTVGWFTTIAPVWISGRGDILRFIKQVKSVRRNTPSKGFAHFTALDLDRKPFEIEVSFNYFGSFQQLDRSDALLQQVHWEQIGVDPCEVSDEHKKFSLIDIAAENSKDQLLFTFSYNKKLRHQQGLKQWMEACQNTLEHMSQAMRSRNSGISVEDFDHLPENYDLQSLRYITLKDLGIAESNVADIYPCSPTQQGMLLTQSKDPNMYWFRSVYEVESNTRAPITPSRLRHAWKAVVQRHPALRTIFIEKESTDGLCDQLVLRDFDPDVSELQLGAALSEEKLLEKLKIETVPHDLQTSRKPQHQLRIVQQVPTGRIFCSLLISHAIVDGSSMGIILRDLDLACQSKLGEKEPQLKNYITYLKSRDHASDIAYWKESLDGVEPCYLLPEPNLDNTPRAMCRADVVVQSDAEYKSMTNAARELGVSPFTILQLTWALTLREFVNPERNDCCFGIVTSGRDLPIDGIHDIAGPLVNILTTRLHIPQDASVSEIATMVHNRFIDNLSHQTSSLAEVTHEVGNGTLFNTGMTLQKIPKGSGLDDSAISFHAIGGEDPTEFDIVIHAIDDGNSMHVHMNHWCDKVSATRATEIARVFSMVLKQIVQQPDMMPSELNLISEKDVSRLWAWNAKLPRTVGSRIEELIAQRAKESPNREALWSSEDTLTFQELDQISTRIAIAHLPSLSKEEVVPLFFEKSIWAVVAMVAVLKAGGTVVLLDPSHPMERLHTILRTVKAKKILASKSLMGMCTKNFALEVVTISKNTASLDSRATRSRLRPRSSSDSAYIVFTSGSTGTPKGSVTEHQSFCTAIQGYHKAIGMLPETRVLQFASYSFDASILETLGSLMVGATVCIPTERERSNDVADFINRSKVSFAVVTPTTASLLRPEEVPTLTCLALCGEPMTRSHINQWADKVRLVNAFGPSECCVGSAANPRLTLQSSAKCIGWAVSCCYWVVNPRNHNRLARLGSVGELLIEGPILARHYLGEEEKTKEAFIATPAWAKPGRATRLYKTGDLVYQNVDGSFQYVGRKDNQAKIRGQRLELGDVEQAIKDVVPHCQSAVAEVIKPEGQPPRLIAFFCTESHDEADVKIADVQTAMSERVPSYMVPSTIIAIQELPMMASGKVDRKKIRVMGAALPVTRMERSGRLPETAMEVALAAIWRDILKTNEQILADDSFFQVGGDSFGAMALVTQSRSRGIVLTVSTIMQAPVLEAMALRASWSGAEMDNSPSTSLVSQFTAPFSMVQWTPKVEAEVSRQCRVSMTDIEDLYPCTPLQEGLFVLSVKQPGAYMARHCFRLSPELNIVKYQQAWDRVFETSEILRTHLVQLTNAGGLGGRKSGLYQAVIKKPLAWQHEFVSLKKYTAVPPQPALGGALVRFAIVQDNENKYLVLTMHHAAYDGTSLGQLLSRVEAEYSGQPQPKSTSFREVIKYLEGTKGTPTNDFWAQYLAGAEASTFPMVPEGYVPSAGTDMEHDLSVPTIKVEGFTLSTLIRVSWALVMSNNSASKDIVFAETLTGRSDDCDGLAEADGPLITTVPNRCKVEPNTELREVLEAMQIGMVEMIPFQQAGLQNIRFVSPDAAEACKFSCLVTIAPESVAQAKSAFGVTPVDGPPAPAIDYAISIQFVIGKDKALKIGVSYDQKLIDETQMKEMVNQFNHVLHQICEGGKYKVMDIEFQPELLIEEDVMSQSTVSSLADRRGANPGVLPPFGHGLDNGCGMLGNDMVSSPSTDSDHVNISQGAMAIDSVIDQASIIASVEREMRSLWSEILEIDAEEIGDDDSFFRIGGDSISAMRLVTTAEQRNISITVADVFHHPKFADLCDFAAQSRAASAEHHDVVELGADLSTPGDSLDLGEPVTGAVVTARSETSSTVLVSMDKPAEEVVITKMKATPVTKGVVIPASKPTLTRQDYEAFATLDLLELDREPVIEAVCSQLNVFPGDVADVFPATDYQAWAVSHGLMRSRGNTNYFLFRLHGNLDTFRLEQACRKMVESNPILRTLFTTLGSQVMQVVLRSYQIEFQRYGREHSADDSFVRWLVEQDTHREAFLSQSIVRFKLLRHALGHYVLVMRVSHAQYDGMSLPLLCQDLQKAYGGEDLAIRPSFGKFIHGGKIREDAAMRFWGELLEGSSMTEIVEHTGPAYRNNVDTMRTRQIPPIPTNVAGMTQATLVKAAWALVLAKMSGQRDVVFGNLVFGRNVPISGIEEISGPCINMIPVRVRLNEMDSIQDLLALVQEQHLSAMPHESLGFRNLIKNCTDWPTWARFSSVVQHQSLGRNVGQDFILGDDVRCEIGVLGPAYDSSDLWVQTTPMEDSFKVEIGSSSAVVSPKIAEILLDRFCTVLTIFGSIGNGRDHHLWELLARDHAPLIPIQSPIIDQVWNNVLPDAASIAWDEPYYMYWGDEIAPVRFLEEFAEHGIHLEVEDILGSPTKQQQMVLIAQVMAGERNGGAASNGATSKKEKRRSGGYHRTNVASPVSSPRDGVSSPTGRSFWVLDSPGKQYGGRGSGSSRGSSARGSPRMMSPKRPAPFGPQRSLPSRRHTSRDNSRPRGAWDMSPAAALSDRHIASAGISSPSMSAHSGRSHGYSRPRISRTATAAVDW